MPLHSRYVIPEWTGIRRCESRRRGAWFTCRSAPRGRHVGGSTTMDLARQARVDGRVCGENSGTGGGCGLASIHVQWGSAGRAAIGRSARSSPSERPLFEAQDHAGYPAHRKAAYDGLARSGSAGAVEERSSRDGFPEKERLLIAMAFALALSGFALVSRVIDELTERRGQTGPAIWWSLAQQVAGGWPRAQRFPNP